MRRLSSTIAVCAFACACVVALTTPVQALAHIKLSSTKPAADSTVAKTPSSLTLEFSADVSDSLQEVRVLGPDGDSAGGEAKADGSTVTVPVQGKAPGTYNVTWRTLGPDGHPISGSYRFTVSAPPGSRDPDTPPDTTTDDPTPPAKEPATDPHAGHTPVVDEYPRQTLDRINTAARIPYYASLLVVIGGALFATVIAPGWRPRYFRRAALLLLLSSIAMFSINLALAGEYSALQVLNPFNSVPHVTTPVGRVAALSALLALYMLRAYPRLREAVRSGETSVRKRVTFAAALLAVVPAIGGHAYASDYALVRVPLDGIHVLAAAIWFGGIVQLQGVSKPYLASHPAVYPAVVRYSQIAFISVVVLVVTGVFAAWAEIGMSVSDLFGTTYGRLVLGKVLLLLATMPLARENKDRNVPAMVEQSTSASVNLRRYVLFEIILVAVIVVLTAWLVYEMPPREMNEAGADHAGHQQG